MKFIVKLEDGVWLSTWRGDPGRTTVRDSARRFVTYHAAKCALMVARTFSAFADAEVEEVEE